MSTKVRIGIVDDHPLFRDGLIHSLSCCEDFEIIGTGATADEAVRIAAELQPDIIISDMNMPGGGITAISRITEMGLPCKVLVLSMWDDVETVGKALSSGAYGYMLKGGSGSELAQAIRTLHQGERYVTSSLAVRLLTHSDAVRAQEKLKRDPFTILTQRENDVLSIMAEGRSNKEIGNKLDLSEKTIKHHVTRILHKLSVRNRVEAVLMASKRKRVEARIN